MRRFFLFPILFLAFVVSACDAINELIPDIETDFSETFQIKIFENNGELGEKLIDVKSSEEYNDFKSNIGGFEIRKITYEIKNFNAPDDMYFTGTLICSNEENTESYVVGSMDMINLSLLAESGEENDVTLTTDNMNKVLAWLDSPGRFLLKYDYIINNIDSTPYLIDGNNAGSNFEMVVKLYVTVKTKI